MKFGRIKRQHGRIGGLDKLLDRIVKNCPHVSRIVPGRIKVRRGKSPSRFSVQYPTPAGLKCQFTSTGTVQEVFIILVNMHPSLDMSNYANDPRIKEIQQIADDFL